MLKRVMVGVCRSPAQEALTSIAVKIAQRHGADITGLAIVDAERVAPVGPVAVGVFSAKLALREEEIDTARDQATEHMSDLRRRVEDAGLTYRQALIEGTTEEILEDVWRFQDLFVLSTRPWPLGEASALRETSVLRLIASGVRPVVAVPPHAPAAPEKIAVALSGSLESAKAMKHVLQLGIWPDAGLHLITSAPPKTGEPVEQLLQNAADYAAAYGIDVTTAVIDRPEDRTTAIMDEAAKVGAQALVIGSSYKRFLAVQRFGSHAQELMQNFPGPIFISH
jgi:nucleotide-binding universal stress UspA family protein